MTSQSFTFVINNKETEKYFSVTQGKWLKAPSFPIKVTAVEWRVEDLKPSSVLFLKVANLDTCKKYLSMVNSENASLVVLNQEVDPRWLPEGVAVFCCTQTGWFNLQKSLCDQCYPLHHGLRFVGVTGTNGKTSTIYFLMEILKQWGVPAISIGTLGVNSHQGKVADFALTSPAYIDFRKTIYAYAENNYVVAFEMSSHALAQKRFYEIPLDSAGWNSFSQDHLDYHQTMQQYFKAKTYILDHLKPSANLWVPENQHDLLVALSQFLKIKKTPQWDDLPVRGSNPIFDASFAQENFLVAYCMAKDVSSKMNMEIDLEKIRSVPGRWVVKKFENKTIIIDYAHTPDALENVCRNALVTFKPEKLKVLFGCGGDRDRAKRPLMGEAVNRYADYIYVTSDNPRMEPSEKIIADILPSITKPYYHHVNREETLNKALQELNSGEVLIVAGKGHEDYIIFGTKKFPYSDEGVCDKYIARKKI